MPPSRNPGRHLSQLGALVAEYERFGKRKGPLPTAPGTMILRSHIKLPILQGQEVIPPPEDDRHNVEQLTAAMEALDLLREKSRRKARKPVRMRQKKRHAAPPMIITPTQLPEYEGLPRLEQTLVSKVVGSGVVKVSTANAGPSVQALLDAVDLRIVESKATNTWKSLSCPFNQFTRFQVEKGTELLNLPNHLQLLTFVESKMADGSIAVSTAHKYVRRVRQVFDMLHRQYDMNAVVTYLRALKRQGALRPESQAPPAMRCHIEKLLSLATPSERVGIMVGWKTASRTDEVSQLIKENFVRTLITTPEGEQKIVWVITFPFHKGDPFGLSTVVPVIFGEWEQEIHQWWGALHVGAQFSDIDTDRVTALLRRVNPDLSSHSIKRGALLTLLRAGVPMSIIQMIAKHKDLETLLVYLPRDEVALALGIWEASQFL